MVESSGCLTIAILATRSELLAVRTYERDPCQATRHKARAFLHGSAMGLPVSPCP